MSQSPDRIGKPKYCPDITPVIYGDQHASAAIGRVKSAEGIDAFVKYLRLGFYRRWLGYVPPLVVDFPVFSKAMQEAVEKGLVTPDNYASAFWNQGFRPYEGKIDNVRAHLAPLDDQLTKMKKEKVHRLSAVTFIVKGDMRSETDTIEGTGRRKYSLVLGHFGLSGKLSPDLMEQASRFYDPELLGIQRALHMSSAFENPSEVRQIMHIAHDRVLNSRNVAEEVERKGLKHPLQGGLPGLGKN